MSDLYLTLKFIHILGSAVLFGTGLGIAFFMVMAHRTRDPATIAATARIVVIADALFTATAVVIQPGHRRGAWRWLVGYLAVSAAGSSPRIVLYVLVGLCWLPVVWIQIAAARSRGGGGARSARRCRRAITSCSASGSGSAGRRSPA